MRVFDAILEQWIDAGSRFTEDSLARMFNVRRSDIRGVLTQLSHQQIIVLRTHHRPRVAMLDSAQFEVPLEGYCDWQMHERIVDQVERGDAVKAVKLLSRHLDSLEQTLLNSGPGLSRNRAAG